MANEMENIRDQPISPMQQIFASCTGSLITSLVVTPLDVIKIRMQAQSQPLKPGTAFIYHNGLMDYVCVCSQCCTASETAKNTSIFNKPRVQTIAEQPWFLRPQHKLHFSGPIVSRSMMIDAMVKISRAEGIQSLWSGLPPTLVMSVPATVMYYTAYDQLKHALGFRDGETDVTKSVIPAVAGVLARTVVTVCASPLEMMRTKMQSESITYAALGQAYRNSIRQTGLGTLMKGLGPHLLRDVPFSAIYWVVYENMKAFQMSPEAHSQPTFLQSFISGAVGGTLAALATNPFDVIKTHRQIELGKIIDSHTEKPVTSTWKLVYKLYQERGMTGLYAGIKPRVLRVSMACAIMISTYEYMKTFFRTYNASLGTYISLTNTQEDMPPLMTLGEDVMKEKAFEILESSSSSSLSPAPHEIQEQVTEEALARITNMEKVMST